MRCEDLERDLLCFIDGELAPPEHREVETHLAECERCRGHVADQHRLKKLLKKSLHDAPQSQPSVALLKSVRSALDEDDVRNAWSRRMARIRPIARAGIGMIIPVAAALFLVVGYVQTVEPLITESVVRHQRNLPLEVTGGPETVQSWFDGKVPFAVPTLALGPHCSLRGGRVSHLGGREAALLQYDQNGKKVSVFVFDANGMPRALPLRAPERRIIGNREVFIEGTSGYHVAVFRDQGLGYAITSSVGESELIQMISTAVGQNR